MIKGDCRFSIKSINLGGQRPSHPHLFFVMDHRLALALVVAKTVATLTKDSCGPLWVDSAHHLDEPNLRVPSLSNHAKAF